jgi:hypothetical protein
MAQKPVNDPYQAENQGLTHGSKLDSDPDPELEQAGAGWGSWQNGKKSPERQKVQRLDVHADVYGDSKRKS